MTLEPRKKVVTIFGSSGPREDEGEYRLAYRLGKSLAEAGFTICNGGYGGTMEAAARGAREGGGRAIGIVAPQFGNVANRFIGETIIAPTPADRLMKLIDLGDAYIVLRGGTGTLVELATVWEYMNKRLVTRKPIVALGTFWSPVVGTLRQELMSEGRAEAARFVTEVKTAEECLEVLRREIAS